MFKLNSLAWPTDWGALFGADRPLIVEIGFGQGTFLLHLARSFPDANVIGLEMANRSLLRTQAKIERAGLTNIRLIHTMAETALTHLFTPASISQIHVNFPDPWFKNDHRQRRLIQRDTLDAIVSRLAPPGKFYLATDILAYAEMARDLLRATPGLDNLLPSDWTNDLPGRAQTKYEATARREGRACYYFVYGRNQLPAPNVPVIRDLDMPHVVFTSPLELDAMLARFEPLEINEGDIHAHLFAAYLGKNALLIETFVGDPTLRQNIALMIVARRQPDTLDTNEYTIQLSTIGQPRATAGVHRAVKLLADWALSLHPDNQLLPNKVSLR